MNAFETWLKQAMPLVAAGGTTVFKDVRDAMEIAWDEAVDHAAAICEGKFADHYDHSGRKIGALECAENIRAALLIEQRSSKGGE